jgi:MFS family permease
MTIEAKGYGEFKRGWPVVLSALLGIALGLTSIPFYTIGVLAPELAKAFHWTFAQVFFGVTVTSICIIVCGPIVGLLSDRFGVRPVVLTSIVLFGLTFMSFGLTTGSLLLYYAQWAAMAVFGCGTLPITWTRAVNNWFDARRGLALGLSLFGTGVFSYLGQPFTASMIAAHGWRMAYLAVGLLPLVIAFPIGLLFFRDVGPARLSVADRKSHDAARRALTPGASLKEAFGDWRFWLIGCAFLPIAFSVGGMTPNMVIIFKTAGFTPKQAVGLVSFIGLSVVTGRVAGGWLLDRLWAPWVGLLLVGVPAAAYWLLGHGPYNGKIDLVVVILAGLAAGAEYDLMSFLVARYFGMKNFSVIYGGLYSFFSVGAGVGPVVYAAFYDKTHSYATPLTISVAAMLIGPLLLFGLGRYPTFAGAAPEDILLESEAVPHALPV